MPREKVILVGLALPHCPQHKVEEYLDELADLADTASGEVLRRVVQSRDKPDASTFLGHGKAEEVAELCREEKARTVIFDDDLTPAQVRNLEKIFGTKVSDRTGLILDIFARRARTREARTQVELAQYTYLLPRLTRAWTHLSRQAGGIGTRGVGETQLETDRRVIRRRIAHLTEELRRIAAHREVQRRRRQDTFEVALMGYTNVGKSTIMNRLTAARVPVENRLFSTLDTTFRRVPLKDLPVEVLLIDTVGLVRKLPHHLVASFRSTLEQAREADLILHVVDVSHPAFEEQAQTALGVFSELAMDEIPVRTVLNKTDRAPEGFLQRALSLYPEALPVSALSGEGVEALREALRGQVLRRMACAALTVPYERWPDFLNVRKSLRVAKEEYGPEGVTVSLNARPEVVQELRRQFEAAVPPEGR